MITQMKQELDEAGIANHLNKSSKEENDAKLQEVQKEILTQSTQLENVEKQLAVFLGNPTQGKPMSEICYHEMILKETLKDIQFRKRFLLEAAKCSNQQTSQELGATIAPHLIPENPILAHKGVGADEGSSSRSSNYNFFSRQLETDLLGHIQPSRNSSPEPLFQNLPFTTLLQQGLGNPFFLAENELNSGPEVGAYMNPPTPSIFSANNLLPPTMDNISQQAMATSGEGNGKRGLP
ncbi:MADS-box transcription factor 3 [Corchorus olitorius]|uniref:MADS-box transcription factor 3 n=1 Tax=Corchorus olitorius TaxID=93759 RepID=A0A1R3K475_9ROSI|nr:MADS-box transcription factor 3 [Corchorus olitorius]